MEYKENTAHLFDNHNVYPNVGRIVDPLEDSKWLYNEKKMVEKSLQAPVALSSHPDVEWQLWVANVSIITKYLGC